MYAYRGGALDVWSVLIGKHKKYFMTRNDARRDSREDAGKATQDGIFSFHCSSRDFDDAFV